MKKNIQLTICLLLTATAIVTYGQAPQNWYSRGVGGGGALFSPSINPANENEYYVACDMSEIFHTTDFGLSYDQIHFSKIQAGVNSKVIFTNDPNILYCIDYANNEIVPVRSDDGGNSWQGLSGNPDASEETFSIHADYNNPDRVVISYYGSIYFSNNGGTSFTNIHNAVNNGSGALVAGVFFDGQNIFIGTNDGLLVSTNGGITFSMDASTGIPAGQAMYSFAGAKQGSTTRFFMITGLATDIYVGIPGSDYYNFLQGVYSMNYGSGTWIPRMTGVSLASDWMMFVAMAENDTSTVYLAGSNPSAAPDVMKTTNGGTSWSHVFNTVNNQNINTSWCGQGGDHGWSFPECPFGIAVARNNSGKVIFGDFSCVHKTSDGGTTWQQAYSSAADQHPSGAASPTNQNYHSCGLENTTCWQVYWINQNEMFSCFSDIRGCRSTDGGNSWSFNYTGHTDNSMYRIVKNSSNNTLYAATSTVHDLYQSTRLQDATLDASNAHGKVIFSSDNGSTWQTLHDFSHPVFWVATDPNNPNRLYAAVVNHASNLGGIWVSNNINLGASSTWTQLSAPPRTEGHPYSVLVLNDGNLVCTYSGRRNASGTFTASSGIFTYNVSTLTWTDKSDNGMLYWTKDVVIDSNDVTQNTWYVGVFSGWGGPPNGLGGLYKTTDRGSTWTKISTRDRVTSCTFNPSNANQVFVTTEFEGLWMSNDINSVTPAFQLVNSYPFKQPERVFFNPYNANEMWVTSFGNGMKVGSITPNGILFAVTDENTFRLYPNPAKEFTVCSLQFANDAKVDLVVTDVLGRILFTQHLETLKGKLETTLDMRKFSKGIYFVNLKTGSASHTEKLIVQ
jgi:photosystem II stability/assembly factor-like uncharacterized protein